MNNYFILIIIACVIANIYTFILYRKQKTYTKKLFIRAAYLEYSFIDIYHRVNEEIKQEIDIIISRIHPL